LTESQLFESNLWKLTLNLFTKYFPEFDHTFELHFHDYTKIETIM
jgi:hypothetical protein